MHRKYTWQSVFTNTIRWVNVGILKLYTAVFVAL
jgi:hypothetical protein